MKRLVLIPLLLIPVLAIASCEGAEGVPYIPEQNESHGSGNGNGNNGNNSDENDNNEDQMTTMKINIIASGRTITATLEDNAAGRDLFSRLPLEVTLEDYNNTTEKIFYPDPELTLEGVSRGCAPVPGDITIYAPWGNVAIFCKSWSYSNSLVKIGRIEGNGIEALSVRDDIPVRIEKQ